MLTKTFTFTTQQLKTLERSAREIIATAAKIVNSPIPAVSIKSIMQVLKTKKWQVQQEPLQAVAEANPDDELAKWRDRFKNKLGTQKTQLSPEEKEEYISQKKLADEYGIGRTTINHIILNYLWKE